MQINYFKKNKLPNKPGVYFFLKEKQILYIGKATSLEDRVKSYFGKNLVETRGPLLVDMLYKAEKVKWQETDSVLEALILEAQFIKKHQPYYNTREKDDKSFNYVCITKDKLPKVLVVRGKELKNYEGSFFGPYTNGSQLKTALQIIRKIFPFIDEASSKKANLEFYKQIHPTPANTEEYIRNIKNLKLFLQGKKKKIISNLKKEMISYAKNKEFEQAGEVKRQIFALKHINDIALMKNESFTHANFLPLRPSLGALGSKRDPRGQKIHMSFTRIEAYDIAHMSGKNMVGVMTVLENGEIAKSEYKKFKIRTQAGVNDTGALKEVLERRLAHTEWPYPNLIVVDGGTAQINVTKSILALLNIDVPVVSVLKDERHKPKDILGNKNFAVKYKREILLANSEAHRFAIAYHKNVRAKNFFK